MAYDPEPLVVSQEFYDRLMELPDGADVADFFDWDDPEWQVMQLTLVKVPDGRSSISCRSLIHMRVGDDESPTGAAPGAAEDG